MIWLPVRPWYGPGAARTTTPSAAALIGVPHVLATSEPAWFEALPVTGWMRRPNGEVSRPTAGFAHPCAVTVWLDDAQSEVEEAPTS